ncbi:hypothetical protein M409DRAFT_63363 [Zasmidium cellare ATCC 36951]|uniref:BZIP domain-containing protein n=1 Tax=Zasmidium cellare ATCC 36951 TaxID=1080233 RepID=A0A6A6CZX3_ZASCE|nr:uncharacterized protein M409DRAFT_63363 [Zasmidium cellare ATCC 36951]KAF2171770.1 hypothetical protein M409DRAFT_63363 [Zasmidium cellare ATCC 36951]
MNPPSAANPSHPPQYQQDGGNAMLDYQHAQTAAAATATAALSQEHTPTPNATGAGGRKRRPPGAPGSRGVANLTPEQLAKKRANDREAQRAIRERTRHTIESLEQRIRELESQQPFQELQRVVQERDRALAECEELKRRLAAVAGIVGGQNPSLNEIEPDLAALTAQQSPLPSHSHPGQPQQYEQSSAHHIHPDLRSPSSANSQASPTTNSSNAAAYQSGAGTLRKWSPSLDHPPNQDRYNSDGHFEPSHQRAPSVQMPGQPQNGERLGVNFLLDTSKDQSSVSPYHSPPGQDPNQPMYARLTHVGPSSCPLDSLLIDFHKSRRKMLREGSSQLDAIGPDYPAFAAMLDPASHPRPHPVSALLIDILSKFPDIAKLPEKVAVLYIMFLVMRWLICPCAQCYERLPEFCRPVAEQLERPHVAWADYLPWPHQRRQHSINDTQVKFEDWFVPYTTTLSLNWDLPNESILIPQKSNNQDEPPQLTLNPAFEHHLRDLVNWSLGTQFSKAFPDFVDGTVRIRDS